FRRTEAVIRVAGLDQPCGSGFVFFNTLRLKVRPLVPVQAQPRQRIENAAGHFFAGSFNIGIFDPKNKDTVMFARKKPDEQGSTCGPYMKKSSRRWSDSSAYRTGHSVQPGLPSQFP